MKADISKKVLTLSTSYDPPKGGIAQVVYTYSRMYPVFNHIVTKKGDSLPEKLVALFLGAFKFIYFCLFKGIRIVHIHAASYNSFKRKGIFIRLAKILKMKIVFHVHGGAFKEFYKNNSAAVTAVFSSVDVIVALSDSWRLFFIDHIGHSKVIIVENVVSPPTLLKVKDDDLIHFLFLGELGKNKGIYDLFEAISENYGALEGRVKFHIGGNGEVNKVRQHIRALGLEDMVISEGWVSGENKIHLLNLADVYILPSYNEGLPISILEAMSYKLPIISTPVGGIPEVVTQDENGLLVSPGDKHAIGEAILKMTMDEKFRRSAGESSYLKVQPHFPDNVAKKLEALYAELLD